jgi:hypothetical protein
MTPLGVLALLGAALGCQHVAGKCDCGYNPSDYPLHPPTNPYASALPGAPVVPTQPGAPSQPIPPAQTTTPPKTMPKSDEKPAPKTDDPKGDEKPAPKTDGR